MQAKAIKMMFGHLVEIRSDTNELLGKTFVGFPVKDCAPGWTDRGHAKTAEEAEEVALRWANGGEA